MVNKKLIQAIMAEQGISGLPTRRKGKPNLLHRLTTEDFVNRDFQRHGPNQLWMTDVTEHPTREGKLYCCVVLDAFSRRVVGWSLDRRPTAAMVNAALGMAIEARKPTAGALVHSDHGSQGGFNRSSQHLTHGGVEWRQCGNGSERSSCIGDRSLPLDGRRWHGARTGSGSGRRLLAA